MNKIGILTKYIPIIQADSLGDWIVDKENDGTIQIPFVSYSEMVNNFIKDVYIFEESNKDMGLTHYGDILKGNGLDIINEDTDISNLNAQCVLALIIGVIRAECFCEGTLLDFFKNGCILKWLEKLDSIKKDVTWIK
jgi:hypothetical protein